LEVKLLSKYLRIATIFLGIMVLSEAIRPLFDRLRMWWIDHIAP